MPGLIKPLILWLQGQPIISLLLILMVADVGCGLARAFVTKTLSSTVSWRGMTRKVVMLILVGVASAVEPYAGGIPLSKGVALFYVAAEFLSILENAAAIGVPLPQVLIDALSKLKEAGGQKGVLAQPSVVVNVPQDSHISATVDVAAPVHPTASTPAPEPVTKV